MLRSLLLCSCQSFYELENRNAVKICFIKLMTYETITSLSLALNEYFTVECHDLSSIQGEGMSEQSLYGPGVIKALFNTTITEVSLSFHTSGVLKLKTEHASRFHNIWGMILWLLQINN